MLSTRAAADLLLRLAMEAMTYSFVGIGAGGAGSADADPALTVGQKLSWTSRGALEGCGLLS